MRSGDAKRRRRLTRRQPFTRCLLQHGPTRVQKTHWHWATVVICSSGYSPRHSLQDTSGSRARSHVGRCRVVVMAAQSETRGARRQPCGRPGARCAARPWAALGAQWAAPPWAAAGAPGGGHVAGDGPGPVPPPPPTSPAASPGAPSATAEAQLVLKQLQLSGAGVWSLLGNSRGARAVAPPLADPGAPRTPPPTPPGRLPTLRTLPSALAPAPGRSAEPPASRGQGLRQGCSRCGRGAQQRPA